MPGRRLVVLRLLAALRSRNATGAAILVQNPIALLEGWKERAMGFFLKRPSTSLVSQQLVGVDVGRAHLLVLGVERKADGMEITHFCLEPRPSSPDEVSARLRAIFEKEQLNPQEVRAAIKTDGMVIRILTFPQMKKSELTSMLHYEAEKYIPFKSSDVVLDFQILAENIPRGETRTMEVVLVAVKQSEVQSFLSVFQKAKIELGLIDVGAFALSNLLEYLLPETATKPVAFLDMGMETSTFGILSKGRPLFIRDISFGGGDILKLLKRKLGLESEQAVQLSKKGQGASADYCSVVEQALSGLANELKLSLGYYQEHVPGAASTETLFAFGGGFRLLPELKVLEKEIQLAVRRPDLFSKVRVQTHLDLATVKANSDLLSTALGLCVR